MPTIISHPAIPLALAAVLPQNFVSRDLILAGAACSILPDIDVIGFDLGVRYGDLFGHRGFTHSIFFAVVLSVAVGVIFQNRFLSSGISRFAATSFLFVCTISHGLLDAMTNGGLGVAFFSPFSNIRYFFPWRPIDVSPIGAAAFFSTYGLQALFSEIRWIWLPCIVVGSLGVAAKYF